MTPLSSNCHSCSITETPSTVTVKVFRLPHARGLEPLEPATPMAAGMDLRAAIEAEQLIEPGGRACVPTGLIMEIPLGFEGQVRPRSGLAANHGVTVLNSPGTIDADYRGEVKVILINLGTEPFSVTRGMRIAQLLIKPVILPMVAEVPEISMLNNSQRGSGGFGSTGHM